jgi:hypothetical protein
VTHGVGYLPQTDLIVVLSSGTISEVGTYDQLLENNEAFAKFLHTYQLDEVQESLEQEPGEQSSRSSRSIISIQRGKIKNCDVLVTFSFTFLVSETEIDESVQELGLLQRPSLCRQRTISSSSHSSIRSAKKIREVFRRQSKLSNRPALETMIANNFKPIVGTLEEETLKGKLVDEEISATGKVQFSVYKAYFKQATYIAVFGMIGSFTMFNALNVSGSFWLTAWTADSVDPLLRNSTSQTDYRLGIYAMFGGLQGSLILN